MVHTISVDITCKFVYQTSVLNQISLETGLQHLLCNGHVSAVAVETNMFWEVSLQHGLAISPELFAREASWPCPCLCVYGSRHKGFTIVLKQVLQVPCGPQINSFKALFPQWPQCPSRDFGWKPREPATHYSVSVLDTWGLV